MGCSQLEAFVEVAAGGHPPKAVRVDEIQEDVLKRNIVKSSLRSEESHQGSMRWCGPISP